MNLNEQIQFNKPEEIHPLIKTKPPLDESPEEYLARVIKDFSEGKFTRAGEHSTRFTSITDEYSFRQRKDILPVLFSNLRWLKDNAKRQSEDKDLETLSNLEKNIKSHTEKTFAGDETNIRKVNDFYFRTRKSRNFFTKKYYPNSAMRDAYELPQEFSNGHVYPMFGVPEHTVEVPEVKEYLHSIIDNKNIYLFGGGASSIDLIKSEEYKPKSVINIDPYIESEKADKNSNKNYRSLSISAADPKLVETLKKDGLPKADQILSLFSVPYYLNSSAEIANLIKNISLLLAPKGEAHIYPVFVSGTENDGENFSTRKETLLKAVKELVNSKNLNITMSNGSLHIHKLEE